ncbi:MAG: glycosyltransferase [Nitrospira sp.]|nr:glycosyltransferase [Nitrospira sp.]
MACVSVIIPTFNRFPFLCCAVDSVLKQTHGDVEIIVIDDGSTDDTPALFSQQFPSIQYVNVEHSGLPAVARNAGIKLATGEFIAFLDSDDEWLPDKLAQQLDALGRSPRASLVCSNAFVIHQDNENPRIPYLRVGQGKSGLVLQALAEENFVITSTVVVRRSLLNQVGLFCEEPALVFGEDYDLWLRIATASEIIYLPQTLAIYRDVPSASIRGRSSEARQWESRLLILKRLRQSLRSHLANVGKTEAIVQDQSSQFREYCVKAYWSERQYLRAIPHLLVMCHHHPVRVIRAVYRRIKKHAGRVLSESATLPLSSPTDIRGDGRLKLHLGCGEVYLPGYVNVDFPPTQHSVQRQSKADLFADLSQLHYSPGTVDEIRLHHVFEHFERPVALRLLIDWYGWLREGGQLIIETPDFHRCVQAYLSSSDLNDQMKIVRHLFGSHEAGWAVHYDGWYRERFTHTLTALGYQKLEFITGEWKGTYNITVIGTKGSPAVSKAGQVHCGRELLKLSLVDESPTEMRMLQAWVEQFEATGVRTHAA